VALTGNLMLKPAACGFNKCLGLNRWPGALTDALELKPAVWGLTGGLGL